MVSLVRSELIKTILTRRLGRLSEEEYLERLNVLRSSGREWRRHNRPLSQQVS